MKVKKKLRPKAKHSEKKSVTKYDFHEYSGEKPAARMERLTEEESTTLRSLHYHINDQTKQAKRELFLKHAPGNPCSLSISNIPPFLTAKTLEVLLTKALQDCYKEYILELKHSPQVILRKSTAFDGDINAGYRSGTINFHTADHAVVMLKKCETLPSITLELLDGYEKIPIGLNRYILDYNSRFVPPEDLLKVANETAIEYTEKLQKEKAEAADKGKEPDEDGWITVTKDDKLSFRGMIKKKDTVSANLEIQKQKSRKRKRIGR
ncbi:ribosomal RNA-processing protein 7 (RRP7) domain-containing protein [Ditylenchus destructor]|uniref:Ribosomal RNA-processing protein 7 (RRP7) domain-containing protein n=1 Tax=Ditylenchus destructor TaxID=166010 RepID=A0AAD4N2V9_9BILA|nr:ribosomal RNA-processing protein 7 (RRP7) domain-containing protein [Ditylenchus destructor]